MYHLNNMDYEKRCNDCGSHKYVEQQLMDV